MSQLTLFKEKRIPKKSARRQLAQKEAVRSFNIGASAYTGAENRFSMIGWRPTSSDPLFDNFDLDILRGRSRDLYRNNPIARGAILTNGVNVVGSGLVPQSRIDREFLGLGDEEADAWETNCEREFSLWAESKLCDLERSLDFYSLQEHVYLSYLQSGDVFVLLRDRPYGSPYRLALQVIEADRVSNPDMAANTWERTDGILVDSFGAPLGLYISSFHPGGSFAVTRKWEYFPIFGSNSGRRNVIHLFRKERPGQRRGVPYLTPVIEKLKELGKYSQAEIEAAVVSAAVTGFVKYQTESKVWDDDSLPEIEKDLRLKSGAILGLPPNTDFTLADPTRPNASFEQFVNAVLRQIGVALEIPFELLIKSFMASYSASRAALLEAWKSFRVRREFFATHFCQEVYEEWMAEAISSGRIDAPSFFEDEGIRKAYTQAQWVGPSPGQIDPVKETEAAKMRVEEGFSTRSMEAAAISGGDFEMIHRQRVKEEKLRREGGLVQDVISRKKNPSYALASDSEAIS